MSAIRPIIRSIFRSISRPVDKSAGSLVIGSIFKGDQGAYYDANVLTSLYQDSSKTNPVTAVGDPIGAVEDLSGNGNDATQATSGSRPVLGIRPKAGVRNLLTYSEDLVSATLFKVNITTPSAGVIQAGTGTAAPYFQDTNVPTVASQAYVFQVEASSGTHDFLQFTVSSQGSDFVTIDLSDGTVGSSGGSVTTSISDLGGGNYLLTFGYTAGGTNRYPMLSIAETKTATRLQSWTPSGTETVNVSKRQFEAGSSATSYQLVREWYDVTQGNVSAGNHVYRICGDGTDDHLTISGSASTLKFLHDGTGAYVSGVFQFGNTVDPAARYGLIASTTSTLEIGVRYSFDDTGGGRENAINTAVFDGSGSPELGVITSNDVVSPNAPQIVGYDYLSSNTPQFRVLASGESVGTASGAGASTADSTNDVIIMAEAASTNNLLGAIESLIIVGNVPSQAGQKLLTEFLADKSGITL